MPKKYALVIGNTEYTDPSLAKLNAPGKDAEDFARALQSKELAAFDEVTLLINRNAHTLSEAIEDFFADKKPDDLLVFYFSGHGVRDDEGALFLAVQNTRKNRWNTTAVTAELVRKMMDRSRSTRQVVILDCCNAGAFPQGQTKGEKDMGMSNTLQGYGRVVLTATDKVQYALEGNTLIQTNKSLFTHFLIKGLEGEADRDDDGKITVDELYDYAFEKVRKATPNQTPTKSAIGQKGEIILREGVKKEVRPAPLPADLLAAAENTMPYVREAAVRQLENLLNGKNAGLALSARKELQRIIADENTTHRVAELAKHALENTGQMLPSKEEERPGILFQIKVGLTQLSAHIKNGWSTITSRLQSSSQNKSKVYISLGLAIVAVCAAILALYQKYNDGTFFFSGILDGAVNIYFYDGNTATIFPQTKGIKGWSPVLSPLGELYFTSDKDGTAEIYRLNKDGDIEQVTNSSGSAASWSPTFDLMGQLYFTSNQDGSAEIYRRKNDGSNEQITDTPGSAASWSPVFDSLGQLYFTSNRDGSAEIYHRKNDGSNEQITDTPGTAASWSPVFDPFGRLYFTSNRDGSVEIYRRENNGSNTQITHTPHPNGSWDPIFSGGNLYFTSNRNNRNEIFLLGDSKVIATFSIENWKKPMDGRYPLSIP